MPKWKPLLAAVLLVAPFAAAQPRPADRNAALKYWSAWSTLDAQTAEEIGAVDVDQPGAAASVKEKVVTLETFLIPALIDASRLSRCDFEVETEKGIEALLAHLGPARRSVRALRVAARLKLEAGDAEAAAERVAAMYRIAEHMSHDNVLISSLVSVAITVSANYETRAILDSGRLTAAARTRLLDGMSRLSGTDPFHTRAAIAGEEDLMVPWIRQFTGPDAGDELATKINSGIAADQPQLAAIRGQSAAEIAKLTEGLSRYYDDARTAWDDDGAVEKLNALGKDIDKKYGVLAAVLGPALGRARASDLKAQAELAETLAAVKAAKVK